MIFTKRFHANEFLRGGRSLVGMELRADYERLYEDSFAAKEAGLKEYRYSGTERFLKLKRKYPGTWYSETPVILSTALVNELLGHLEATSGRSWQQVLLGNLGWTEYTLYFTYAEATGSLRKFHEVGDCDSVTNFSHSLLWGPDAYRDRRTLRLGRWPGFFACFARMLRGRPITCWIRYRRYQAPDRPVCSVVEHGLARSFMKNKTKRVDARCRL